MPVPACFHLADHVFPRVRAEAARRLVADGWSQSRTADAIGVSQAMISKYQARDEDEDPLVLRLVDELIADLDNSALRDGPSTWCTTLTVARDHGDHALDDLLQAERHLLSVNIAAVMPQVGMNLARALPGATDPSKILAYPARLVLAGDRILRPAPPVLGGSKHLAACLLALRARDEDIHALANIRGGADLARIAGTSVRLDGDGDRTELFLQAVQKSPRTPMLIHDPGAIGIEPCLYVAGHTATDVAKTILRLASQVPP